MKKATALPVISILLVLLSGAAFCEAPMGERAKRIAEALRLQPGSTLADVGAGEGEWTVELAAIVGPGGRVYATEVDDKVLSKLKKAVSRAKLQNVTVVRGDQERTGLEAACCDAILLRHVYHHFSDPKAMQAGLLEALKPGGLLALVDFSPDNGLSRGNVPEFRGGHGVTAAKVEEEMVGAGFELVLRKDGWDDRADRYLLLFRRPYPALGQEGALDWSSRKKPSPEPQ